MPQSVRLGRPSQAVSRHQATASREHQLGLILQRRERWGWWWALQTALSASASDTASNNTLRSCWGEERGQVWGDQWGEAACQAWWWSPSSLLPQVQWSLAAWDQQTNGWQHARSLWSLKCLGSRLPELSSQNSNSTLTRHGWVSLVCSVEIDLSCICYILFPPQTSTVLQWNVQFTFVKCISTAKHDQLALTQPTQPVLYWSL